MGFAKGIMADCDLMLLNISEDIKDISVEFGESLVDYSPGNDKAIFPGAYSNGLFANSWYVGFNEFDETVGTLADESASGSLQRVRAIKNTKVFFKEDDYISFSNNLSYAYRVEFDGWPEGRDPESGWYWTGFVGPYAPVRNSITYIQGFTKT